MHYSVLSSVLQYRLLLGGILFSDIKELDDQVFSGRQLAHGITAGTTIAHKHLPRDIFRSFEKVFIRLLMSEVSSDSKVKHIHKQTFCKRYFF